MFRSISDAQNAATTQARTPETTIGLPLHSRGCTVEPVRNVRPALFVALLLCGCGNEVIVETNDPNTTIEHPDAGADAADDAADDASVDASVDAAEDSGPPPPCHCPNAPPCVKPMECCPVVGQCKDPATFNCTGSAIKCP